MQVFLKSHARSGEELDCRDEWHERVIRRFPGLVYESLALTWCQGVTADGVEEPTDEAFEVRVGLRKERLVQLLRASTRTLSVCRSNTESVLCTHKLLRTLECLCKPSPTLCS